MRRRGVSHLRIRYFPSLPPSSFVKPADFECPFHFGYSYLPASLRIVRRGGIGGGVHVTVRAEGKRRAFIKGFKLERVDNEPFLACEER